MFTYTDNDLVQFLSPDPFLNIDTVIEAGKVVAVRVEADVFGDHYTTTSSAVCDPADRFNSETGLKLALGRAIRQLGRDILQDGHHLVHQADQARQSQLEAAAKAKRAKKASKAAKKKG